MLSPAHSAMGRGSLPRLIALRRALRRRLGRRDQRIGRRRRSRSALSGAAAAVKVLTLRALQPPNPPGRWNRPRRGPAGWKPPGTRWDVRGERRRRSSEASPLSPCAGERGYGGERRKAKVVGKPCRGHGGSGCTLPEHGYQKTSPNLPRAAFLITRSNSAQGEKKGITEPGKPGWRIKRCRWVVETGWPWLEKEQAHG